MPQRRLRHLLWAFTVALGGLRLFYLTADFPNNTVWAVDQAKFTDEGWWGQAATMHRLTGHWNIPGDYNPAIALPVWPTLLGVVFHFSGVSIVAARALAVGLSLGTLVVVYLLVRRYGGEMAACVAALMVAASPFAFVFSRLAILDSLLIFEFCLLMLASYAAGERMWRLAGLTVLTTGMLLTKTTAAVVLPAVGWLAWTAMGKSRGALLRVVVALVVLPAILLQAYAGLVGWLGYGADYHYFFGVNRMSDMVWGQSFAAIWKVLCDCLWIDPILYPASVVVLVLSLTWLRRLWSNPLFAAAWIAFLSQAVFLFRRSDDYAPRYLLMMLVPVVVIVVLAAGELRGRNRIAATIAMAVIAVSTVVNVAKIGSYVARREFCFYNAAQSIRTIVESDAGQNREMVGISASQLSLMTGVPSINDAYGTMGLAEKVRLYQPGWYVAWNGIGPNERAALANYRMDPVASYPLFDDDERNLLILYRMERMP